MRLISSIRVLLLHLLAFSQSFVPKDTSRVKRRPTCGYHRVYSYNAQQAVWYSDPDLERDRSHVLSAPSFEDAVKSEDARFVIVRDRNVFVQSTSGNSSFVEGLFLHRHECLEEWFYHNSSVVAWLGRKKGKDYYVVDISPDTFPAPFGGHERILSAPLRQFGDNMQSMEQAAIYATANGVVEFHRSHPFCSKCGHRTLIAKAGACRRCSDPSCKTSVYPRIDTATIMLITSPEETDGSAHALLGRKKSWPAGRWSTLAGFVEVGETLELCVVREVMEESGVLVEQGSVRFVASQPWPFPRSLMAGFTAVAVPCPSGTLPTVDFDANEMEDVRWFSREYVASRLDGGSSALDFEPTKREAEFHIPGKASLARLLISNWALEE